MPKREHNFEAGGGDKEHAKKEHAKKRAKPSDDVQALRATTASERVKIAAAAVKNAGKGEGRAPIEFGGDPKKDKEREKPQKEICAICQEVRARSCRSRRVHRTRTVLTLPRFFPPVTAAVQDEDGNKGVAVRACFSQVLVRLLLLQRLCRLLAAACSVSHRMSVSAASRPARSVACHSA
jgi:hypothetical protein